MPVERSELQLVWPPGLFAAEARALLSGGPRDESTLGFLLAEAFYDDRGLLLFDELSRRALAPDAVLPGPGRTTVSVFEGPLVGSVNPHLDLVRELMRDAESLPRYEPRRYWSQRRQPRAPAPPLSFADLKRELVQLVHQLDLTGYFDASFGSSCCDSGDRPDQEGQRKLSEALYRSDRVWPMGRADEDPVEQGWAEEVFFDVVEALHDYVARPRRRRYHSFCDEWDYDEFARDPGQAVYRWKVNALFERSEVLLRLAGSGPERGFLVTVTGDPRDELVDAALATPDPGAGSAIAHAIALFRSRSASRDDKRSAVVALARVLEDRRRLIKESLLSNDEGALFRIANEFDLRHCSERQRADYNGAFLDWTFWWYLATVDLLDRILARQQAAAGGDTAPEEVAQHSTTGLPDHADGPVKQLAEGSAVDGR